jgi:hypothetical protein
MNLRTILLGAAMACAALGCSTMDEPPPPQPVGTMNPGPAGPPVDEGAPINGGELFNGNY